ncbi:MAG TPA: bifunctional nuclease domain-containing protein, partial [Candidatus Tectomicrobia bacterium]|nr:bifunctional nuclease domain-containing protein [Candidatus Tectomicrobia bacterium]
MGAGEHAEWQLALWLPDNEAERLARALGLAGHGCVGIFDLVEALLEKLGCRVTAAVLDTAAGAVVAALRVGDGTSESAIACHPADAIALATRAGAPIYATAE